ncbi:MULTISPECIES: cell division protein FtsQ/DivIB [Thermoanaerobacterium]|uniref:Polypeptide-transport-associated domain-containing protein FtsQ-type n=3 Tax=Thermoanaerobacterium TaxID=28895 RepID=W9E938_9THEO|nr:MULTISPECIES: FtsQ-type POTRA domain-containing protein [Thermoanaerobacterium]AFK86578.1 Polypeptide-transport-associated domain protein FtsQ-type [Thermoanaerobacterium saccharolyticum JW/SL-YS485]ETO38408.1 polypeptide-transport-associated domain-containing protein FtsQ-type [Thermoanaerobacterium aotearoense SCUT27]
MMEERQYKKKKRFSVFIVFLLIFSIILYVILFRTSLFDVKNIYVYGTRTVDKSDVIRLSGIEIGSNILKINKSDVIKSIMRDPYIKDVSINILYPSKVEIRVDERLLAGQISYKDKFLYVDTDCVAVQLGDYNNKLPILSGINIEKFEIGSKIDNLSNNKDIAKLLPLIYNKNIYNAIIVNGSKITLKTNSGINVVLENVDDINYSLNFSEKILNDLEKKGYNSGNVLIVSNGNPIYTP